MHDPTDGWIVPIHLLDALAGEMPDGKPSTPAASPSTDGTLKSRLQIARWLNDRGVPYRVKSEPDASGRRIYVLKNCPFDPSHADPDACVMQSPDGRLSAKCFHNSCQTHGWKDFKARIGPPTADHYDPPLKAPRARIPGKAPVERETEPVANGTPVIVIDPAIPVRETMRQITDVFIAAKNCYRRAGDFTRVVDDVCLGVTTTAELAGALNTHVEVQVRHGKNAEYKPLPAPYGNTWLHHPGEKSRLPEIRLFTSNPVFTEDWRLTGSGYDPATGIFYAGPPVAARSDTTRLDTLLAEFCFKTAGDRTNFVGVLLTALLVTRFIGAKPALLLNGNQPGLGKSILAQIVAIVRDGRSSETASYNPNDEEFEKRLGAIVKRGATTIIIDNAKGRGGRSPRIDSACLERSITDPILSYRLLGQSKEIRAENSHIFCITANSPDVSPDLVSRSVIVNLFHEGNPKRRRFEMADPEGYAERHRTELLGELIGMVERWREVGSPESDVDSRFNKKGWGRIVGGILQVARLPEFLVNAESAAVELDDTRREFAVLLELVASASADVRTATELVALAKGHRLFADELNCSEHAAVTRIGMTAGRYLGERFKIGSDRIAILRRDVGRNGAVYRVEVQCGES